MRSSHSSLDQRELTVDDLLEQAIELHRQGKRGAAAEMYRIIVEAVPEHATAWHLMGIIALQSGSPTAALRCLQKAVSFQPDCAEIHLNLGRAHQACGQLSASMTSLEHSLRLDPTVVDTWVALSEVLYLAGETTPATDCLRQALLLDEDHCDARLLLANIQKQFHDLENAERNYHFVLRQEPGNVVAATNLASLLRQQGRIEESLALLKIAAALESDSPLIRYNLANTLVDAGRFSEARQHYEEAILKHPQPAKVFYNLSTIIRFNEQDRPRLAAWEQIARQKLKTTEDRVHLNFALGKAYDDLGDYDTAFAKFSKANKLAKISFDPTAHRRRIDSLIAAWDQEVFQQKGSWGDDQARPIFVIGMPRSGTTLVEQILSRHSQISGRGERTEMGELVERLSNEPGLPLNEEAMLASVSQTQIAAMAAEYRERVFGNADWIVDKMPTNFLLLGWIALCFPKARLVHCRRDPRDTCLSCYFQHFTQRLPFTYDLNHLASYYRQYERLMQHWDAVLPVSIHSVQYEDLVSKPETVSRQMIEFCGLEWEPICLKQDAPSSTITTASHWQARQAIYTSSRQRWRHYKTHLAPLLNVFGDEAD